MRRVLWWTLHILFFLGCLYTLLAVIAVVLL